MRKLFLLAVFACVPIFSARVACACSCGGYPAVCGSFRAADAVFVGSVQRIELPKPQKDDEGREYVAGQVAYVQVEKVFKGTKQTQVIFRTEGSSCDAVYEEGERWLFYAYYDKKSGRWSTHACDRSTRIESAADDLLYLQALPASAQKTRISGELKHYEDDPAKGFSLVKNIIGAKVTIKGEQRTYEVYTDKNGVYEVYGLPPGKYQVEPETPPGLRLRFPIRFGEVAYTDKMSAKLVLRDKGCVAMDFLYSADTSVSGTLFGADGRALPHVCLNLLPKGKPATRGNWKFDCTDERGRYNVDEIPPGEYLIVVNDENKISSNAPFPAAYYPGVFEKEKATVITLAAGDRLEGYDIHIPAQEATRVLRGVLLYSDGHPVEGEFVNFKADSVKEGYDGETSMKTDAQGRFSLTVLQGLRGSLYGVMLTYEGEYANCPQLDKILRANGRSTEVTTKPLKMEINSDAQDIKLVFPFPRCEKARE
ncbi:MAG TPA: carboxypeptidase-like regulatory domain-containing protein [Pyrinomonadaceae bacterium]|nr:carboxypeptidase-like regulatory domain-containing protein [Pyrinomonadaceae bacterium]